MLAANPRFYLDENVPVAIAGQLRRRGVEVVTVLDLGLLGDTDVNHLSRATQMGYVFCTYDADYLQMASEGQNTLGLCSGRPKNTGLASG